MKIDPMTKLVIATMILTTAVWCAVAAVAVDSINKGIPTAHTGIVVSKGLVPSSSSTVYSIEIYSNSTSTNMTLYIFNDKTLYDSIIINKTYSFSCLQSFRIKMELIQYATEVKTD